MSVSPKIAILILAAGSSSRMGMPKQLLPWENTFLLNHAINNAIRLEHSKTFVVLGANYELIKPKLQREDIQILYNSNWVSGLGNSIGFGVQYIQNNMSADGVLILLGDQPLVDSNYINLIVDTFESNKHQIIASNYGPDASGERLGVPALFDKFYFEELSHLNQFKGAQKVIANHLNHVNSLHAVQFIADIDTKEEYERMYDANHQ